MSIDVVFNQHRNAVQASAHASRLSLFVKIGRDRERVRIQLNDGVDRGPPLVYIIDPLQIFPGERMRAVFSGGHAALQVINRQLFEFERGGRAH